MWENFKKWGMYAVGALIFVLGLISALRGSGREKPVADVDTTKSDTEQQNKNAVEIKDKQDEVVAVVTKQVVTKPSADIDEAIDRFNRS